MCILVTVSEACEPAGGFFGRRQRAPSSPARGCGAEPENFDFGVFLWPPCVADATIIFSSGSFFFLLLFSSFFLA